MRIAKPEKVKRCHYCGSRKVECRGKPTIFHKPGCLAYISKEVETVYPGIEHGTYVASGIFGIK